MSKGAWGQVKDNAEKRTYTAWVNAYLVQHRKEPIKDLYEDLKSGVKLSELILILSKEETLGKSKITQNPKNKIQMKENVGLVLDFIQNNQGVKLTGIGATDIADGKENFILSLIKALMMKYQIENAGSSEDKKSSKADAKNALLNYLNEEGAKKNIKVDKITTACSDGLLLYALLDSLNPDCIDFNDLDKSDPVKLNQEAINAAHQMFKIPPIVNGKDLTSNPEEIIIMCYLSYFRHVKYISHVYRSMKRSMGLSTIQLIPKLSKETPKHTAKRNWRLLEDAIFSGVLDPENGKKLEKFIQEKEVVETKDPKDDKPKEEIIVPLEKKNPALRSLKEEPKKRGRHASIVEKGGFAQIKESADKRIFTAWVNANLQQNRKEPINDLYEDVKDGVKLAELALVLAKEEGFGQQKITKNPKNKIAMKENLTIVLDFFQNHQGIKLIGIGANDIADGKETLILGLFKSLIMTYQIENAGSSEDKKSSKADAKNALLTYLNEEGAKKNITVDKLNTACSDGLLLYALLDSLNPDCIDFNDLDKSDPVKLNQEAINLANQMFKIPPIVNANDITTNPDEIIVMCYLSYFRHVKYISHVYRSMKQSMGLSTIQLIPKITNESLRHKAKRCWRLLEDKMFSEMIEEVESGEEDEEEEDVGITISLTGEIRGMTEKKTSLKSTKSFRTGNLSARGIERTPSKKKIEARQRKVGPTEEDLRIIAHQERLLPHQRDEKVVKGRIRAIEIKIDDLEKEYAAKLKHQETEIEKLKILQEEKLESYQSKQETFKEKQIQLKSVINKNSEMIEKLETALKIEHSKKVEVEFTVIPQLSSSSLPIEITPGEEKKKRIGECLQTPKIIKSTSFDKSYDFKIVLVGDDFVGKFSLFKSYIDGDKMKKFLEKPKYVEYYVEEYTSKVEEKQVDIKIRVAPILNNSHNLAIHKKHMRNADAVVIIYDVTNTSSFTNVHYWNELVYKAKQERNVVKCIIGTKSDQDEERSILSSAALEYCQGEKIPLFFETNVREFDKNRQIFRKIGEVLAKEKLETDTTTIWKPVDDSSKDCIVM